MRRSHSAEGRYCVRKDLETPEKTTLKTDDYEGACGGQSSSSSRRSSYQLQPLAALKFDILNKRRKSNTSRRTSDIVPIIVVEQETEQIQEEFITPPTSPQQLFQHLEQQTTPIKEENLPKITIHKENEGNKQ